MPSLETESGGSDNQDVTLWEFAFELRSRLGSRMIGPKQGKPFSRLMISYVSHPTGFGVTELHSSKTCCLSSRSLPSVGAHGRSGFDCQDALPMSPADLKGNATDGVKSAVQAQPGTESTEVG